MSSTFTKNFKIGLAKSVQNMTDTSANSYLPSDKKSYIYVILGKPIPWNSGTEVAPTPGLTDNNINDYYKRGILAKLLRI